MNHTVIRICSSFIKSYRIAFTRRFKTAVPYTVFFIRHSRSWCVTIVKIKWVCENYCITNCYSQSWWKETFVCFFTTWNRWIWSMFNCVCLTKDTWFVVPFFHSFMFCYSISNEITRFYKLAIFIEKHHFLIRYCIIIWRGIF